MPSATLRKMPKTTSLISSPTERAGRLVGPLMTEAESDQILQRHGFRASTPEESRAAREAIARADAFIACQLASH